MQIKDYYRNMLSLQIVENLKCAWDTKKELFHVNPHSN